MAQTAPSPQGGFIAPALVSFAVNKTTNAKCVLKTVPTQQTQGSHAQGPHLPVRADNRRWRRGRLDLFSPLIPAARSAERPEKPGNVRGRTVWGPAISCWAARSRTAPACACQHLQVRQGRQGCLALQRTVVDPKPFKPTVSEPKISCAGGAVKHGACACEPGRKPVKAGANAWRCVQWVVDRSRSSRPCRHRRSAVRVAQ